MNKEVTLVASGVAGGAVSRGISSFFPATANPLLVNGAMAVATGYAITKVSGASTKDNVIKGMLIGATIVKGLDFLKSVSQKMGLENKLANPTKVNQFLKGFTGLGCPMENGLNATIIGSDGMAYEYDPTGLQGTYMDENGNVYNDGLSAAYIDENGNLIEDGLQGSFIDENGNMYQDGLAGSIEDDLYGLGASIEDDLYALNGVEEEMLGSNLD